MFLGLGNRMTETKKKEMEALRRQDLGKKNVKQLLRRIVTITFLDIEDGNI